MRWSVDFQHPVDARWTLRSSVRSAESYRGDTQLADQAEWQIELQAGRSLEAEFYVPVRSFPGSYSTDSTISVRGAGLIQDQFGVPWSNTRHSSGAGRLSFCVVSSALVSGGWGQQGNLSGSLGAVGYFDYFPSHWLGLAAVDILAITEDEWRTLEPAKRVVLEDWVARGGALEIWKDAGRPIEEPRSIGLGRIVEENLPEDRTKLDGLFQTRISALPSTRPSLNSDLRDADGQATKLADELGALEVPVVLLVVFLLVFALLIGPLNLFVLARGIGRARLFITTPVIAIAASLFLGLLIVFSEGFGGRGIRTTLVVYARESPKEITIMAQTARTSVLLSDQFEFPEPTLFLSAINAVPGMHQMTTLRERGLHRNGDWFRSRAIQAHYAERVRTTRSSVVHQGDVLQSNLDLNLQEVFFVKGPDDYWRGGPLASGGQVSLQKATRQEFLDWWAGENWHPRLQRAIKELGERPPPGSYFGRTLGATGREIESLQAIQWSDIGLVYGAVE